MSVNQAQAIEFVELLKQERKDSAKERKELHIHFLEGIKNQTEQQSLAMKTLGDRMERQIEGMRKDVRSATNRFTWSLVIALLVVASLAGVAVKYDRTGTLELNPMGDAVEPPPHP